MLERDREKWAITFEMLRTVSIAGAIVYGTWQSVGKVIAQDFVENTLDHRIGKIERSIGDLELTIKELEREQKDDKKDRKELNKNVKELLKKLDEVE